MQQSSVDRNGNWLFIAAPFLLLLVYVFVRAWSLSFTHDESLSFSILEGDANWINTANNHQLNTKLMGYMNDWFGSGEFSLRFPNVLAFLLYLVGAVLLIRESRKGWLMFSGLVLLLLHPFMLEFFSLARGYGLSLGLLLIGTYFFLKAVTTNDRKKYAWNASGVLLTLGLAVQANLSVINVQIAVLLLLSFGYFRLKGNQQKLTWKELVPLGVTLGYSLVFLVRSVERLLMLKEGDQLYYGESSLWSALKSIVDVNLYQSTFSSGVTVVLIVLFIAGGVWIVLRKKWESKLFWMFALVAIVVGGWVLEQMFFGAKYPSDRTGLILVPLLGLFLFYLIQDLSNKFSVVKWIVAVPIALLVFNFFWNANVHSTQTWNYDRYTKQVAVSLIGDKDEMITVDCHWKLSPAMEYYQRTQHNQLFTMKWGRGRQPDFLYTFANEPHIEGYINWKYYPENGVVLRIKDDLVNQ